MIKKTSNVCLMYDEQLCKKNVEYKKIYILIQK